MGRNAALACSVFRHHHCVVRIFPVRYRKTENRITDCAMKSSVEQWHRRIQLGRPRSRSAVASTTTTLSRDITHIVFRKSLWTRTRLVLRKHEIVIIFDVDGTTTTVVTVSVHLAITSAVRSMKEKMITPSLITSVCLLLRDVLRGPYPVTDEAAALVKNDSCERRKRATFLKTINLCYLWWSHVS